MLSGSFLRTVARFCCSLKDRAPLRNFSWSRVPRQQQSWTDGLDRDDHERPIRPILCCTEGAVQKQPYHPKEPPEHSCRCAESMPAVQVFPLQLVTLDLSLSPASLHLELSSHASFVDIQINEVANMKICARSPLVQESFLAVELLRHVLSFAIAPATSDNSVIENGGYQSWIFQWCGSAKKSGARATQSS